MGTILLKTHTQIDYYKYIIWNGSYFRITLSLFLWHFLKIFLTAVMWSSNQQRAPQKSIKNENWSISNENFIYKLKKYFSRSNSQHISQRKTFFTFTLELSKTVMKTDGSTSKNQLFGACCPMYICMFTKIKKAQHWKNFYTKYFGFYCFF